MNLIIKFHQFQNSPASQRRKQPEEMHNSRDRSLNRSLDARASKVKDRFTNWRRKSEPGFQSYVSLNQSDDEEKENSQHAESLTPERDCEIETSQDVPNTNPENSLPAETKDVNEQQQQQQTPQVPPQTVEQIVGHILMQNQEFQRLLEKQRNNSILNVRHQQRFNKHALADTSDESDTDNTNYPSEPANNNNNNNNNNIKDNRSVRSNRREHRIVRTNNAWNAFSSPQPRDVQPTLQLRYDNLRTESDKPVNNNEASPKNRASRVYEKRAMFEAFKRQSIVTDSKIIKTALRIREHSAIDEKDDTSKLSNDSSKNDPKDNVKINDQDESKGFGNYDNLQHVWDGMREIKEDEDSPTKPAIWLNKLCEGLPTSPQKAGSLPRSFQIGPNSQPGITKARFLQRDGKPMTDRPFTIASDKPAEINLEDMERYASSCQPEGRIAKFPTTASTSTFFLTLDDNLTDAYSEIHVPVTSTNIHPDHKIYRANVSGSAIFRNVFSKAGSKLQGLRTTVSTETLESNEEFERTKYSRSFSTGKLKKKSRLRLSRESSSDVEDTIIGCVSSNSGNFKIPALYYKQGSSGLGARIAQSDYADPSFLFSESKRAELASAEALAMKRNEDELSDTTTIQRESETDSFYEKSFETIENYADTEEDDAFRDSAIFSDAEEMLSVRQTTPTGSKIAPPVPIKRRPKISQTFDGTNGKPAIANKPSNLKIRGKILRDRNESEITVQIFKKAEFSKFENVQDSTTSKFKTDASEEKSNDVSAGQSQAGWVRKMVGQLQAHIET